MSGRYRPAPVVDPVLADLMAGESNPVEALAEADEFKFDPRLHTPSVDALLKRGRLVRLACAHFTITKALRKAACPRCGAMIRSGWDHDGFRRLGNPDSFHWPDDPLRTLHESDRSEQAARFDPTSPRS